MHIFITGAAGFLGRRLATALLVDASLGVERLTVADIAPVEMSDPRVDSVQLNLADPAAVMAAVPAGVTATYHLAAVVSSAAEADFDLGMRVNMDGTRNLLEALRSKAQGSRLVFTSSLAVYGGALPDTVSDATALTPQSSYGVQKAVGELLVTDYSRKGFIDGVTLRLPTVSVRQGAPNKAASSFASDILREPLFGRAAVCPVDPSLALWLTSPSAAVRSLVHALGVSTAGLTSRSVNAPGVTVTVQEMIETLERVAGPEAATRIRYEQDAAIERIVASWPARFETTQAAALGFAPSDTFKETVGTFVREEL
ncbi:SDR family oxidoreductase [soil metagenome]